LSQKKDFYVDVTYQHVTYIMFATKLLN